VGKTSVARLLAQRLGAVYLRIDSIEQALIAFGVTDPGASGYSVAYGLAADNLRLGSSVVADAVNPLRVTRAAWSKVAAEAGCACQLVEIVCSDEAEHRRRVSTRAADIPGHVLPNWEAILARPVEPITEPRLVIDTAVRSAAAAVDEILAALSRS